MPIDGDIFSAPIIVNAAGAWADEFAASANVKPLGLQPKRRTVILVAPPADHDVENWPLVAAYDGSFYFKPEAGMLLVSPVDEHESPPCDAQPDELDMAYASEFAMQALNGLAIKRIAHSWAVCGHLRMTARRSLALIPQCLAFSGAPDRADMGFK